jgi:pimeloyl-ACP methyl ester carboxylesterase
VLTGGFGLLHNQFDKVRPLLTPHFRVIDWNYRGCGQADRAWPGGYTLDTWVDDLATIMDGLKLDRAALWATSTGSRLAIRFAARFPDRVSRLMVYPTFRMTRSGAGNRDVFADLGETYGYEALGRMFQWLGCGEKNVWSAKGNEIAQYEAACFARNFSIAQMRDVLDIFSHADLSADVAKLKGPTAILIGASGRLGSEAPNNREAIAAFRRLCPQAEVITVPDAGGTYCMIEEPERTAALAVPWLRGGG